MPDLFNRNESEILLARITDHYPFLLLDQNQNYQKKVNSEKWGIFQKKTYQTFANF